MLCRLMADVVLHLCYNMYNIKYSVNEFTWELFFNHMVSLFGLSILIFELLSLIITNRSFAKIEIGKRRDLAIEFINF